VKRYQKREREREREREQDFQGTSEVQDGKIIGLKFLNPHW